MSTYKPNPNRKVYNIDFDGTITIKETQELLVPNTSMIAKIQELYFSGNIIIIWTARLWDDASKVVSFLIKYSIPFHGLLMAKGGSDIYVDDKAMSDKDFLLTKTL